MGLVGHHEDTYERFEQTPKLSLVGRLQGFVDGRPVTLDANGRDVIVVAGFRTLFTLRRSLPTFQRLLSPFTSRFDIRIMLRVGWLGTVEILPDTSRLIRVFIPRVQPR